MFPRFFPQIDQICNLKWLSCRLKLELVFHPSRVLVFVFVSLFLSLSLFTQFTDAFGRHHRMIWQISSISQEHQLSNQCHWCSLFSVLSPFWSINSGYNIHSTELTNMSHLWKRNIIFNIAFHGTYVTSQEGRIHICRFWSLDITQEVVDSLVQLGKFFGWGDAAPNC